MSALGALERYVKAARRPETASCELCAAPLPERHGHVVDLQERRLCCTCQACSLSLGEHRTGRFRGVPQSVRYERGFALSDAEWAAIGVPVGLAFLMRSSGAAGWTALLPSPAGAVEAELPGAAWAPILARWPFLAAIEADVEGLLVRRERGGSFEAFVAPVDACYALVGLVRRHWRGFDGGDAGQSALEHFFAELRERAQALP